MENERLDLTPCSRCSKCKRHTPKRGFIRCILRQLTIKFRTYKLSRQASILKDARCAECWKNLVLEDEDYIYYRMNYPVRCLTCTLKTACEHKWMQHFCLGTLYLECSKCEQTLVVSTIHNF